MIQGYEFVVSDLLYLCYAGAVYFVSFAGPVYLLWLLRETHPLILLLMALAGYVVALLVFIGVVVLTKRLIGPIRPGLCGITDRKAYPWLAAGRLMCLYHSSPFYQVINDHGFLRYLFFRGMGAELHFNDLFGQRISILDPWVTKIGRNTTIGNGAVIAGHFVVHHQLYVDRVEIGDDVLIGGSCGIAPGVRIGNGATLVAGSVVMPKTVIPAGEVWFGIPARKVGQSASAPSAVPFTEQESLHAH
jgi:hypothetical protein